MNIVFIPNWYSNKKDPIAGIFVKEQAQALSKYCNIKVYYPFDETAEEDYSVNQEEGLTVIRRKYKKSVIPKMTFVSNFFKIFSDIKEINRKLKIDILHAHVSYPSGFIAVLIGKIFKIPVVITEHAPVNMLIGSRIRNKMLQYTFTNAKEVVCVSEHLAKDIKKLGFKGNFKVINNGIELHMQNYKIDNQLDKSNIIDIVCISSFYNKEIKGIQYLLPAINDIVRKTSYKLKLHLVGGGEFLNYYKEMSESLHIDSICNFYGNQPKSITHGIVSKCHFLVSSSLHETFGCAIAEAMMMGKPVVVTNSGGPEDFVDDKSGIIVQKESVDALAKGIIQMIDNYDEYDKNYIGNNAYNKFNIDIVTKKYIAMYEDIHSK